MKRILSVLLMVFMIISSTFVNVFADAPGTPQRFKYIEKADGIPMFIATEEGEEFYVYCFNSSLAWPDRPNTDTGYTNEKYIPDDLLELDNYHIEINGNQVSVKDMIHRIFYAGFPHNNAGLYIEDNNLEPTLEDMVKGLDFQPEILKLFPELNDGEYTYLADGTGTLNNRHTTEAQTIIDIANTIIGWSMFGTNEEKAKLSKVLVEYSDFYSFVYAYSNVVEFELDFDEYLSYFYKLALTASGMAVSREDAHSATQIAIWIILKRAGVPRNTKDYEDYYRDEQSLVRRLVDFAYGKDPIPERNYNQQKLNEYKTNFNNGEYLLNKNDESVKNNGGIKFTYNPSDGKYHSEVLKFERKTQELREKAYLSKFNIEVLNANNEVISESIQYGKDEFVLVCDELPANTIISVKSDNYWPSPIYQYRAESDAGKALEARVHQEMSGVRYEKVELKFNMQALNENNDLTIKKLVDNKAAAQAGGGTHFWFNADIKILDSYGNQVSGWLDYTKYKLNDDGTRDTKKQPITGKVYNFGDNGGAYGNNTKFSLEANEEIVIHNLPYGTEYSIVEYGLSETGTSTGNWIPEYTGQTGTVSKTESNTVIVNNTYKYNSVSLQIKGEKTLKDGESFKDFDENSFSFILWPDVHGNPMPEGSVYNNETLRNQKIVSSTASDTTSHIATFDFGTINFDKEGAYSYTIEEQQVTLDNISKDPSHYHVKVVVTEDGTNLNKTVTVERHNPDHSNLLDPKTLPSDNNDVATVSFENKYSSVEIDKEIRVKKTILNNASDINISRKDYVFNVVPNTTDEQELEKYKLGTNTIQKWEITTGDSGEAVTPLLEFKKDWFATADTNNDNKVELEYKIEEKPGSVSGITYSKEYAIAKIIIEKKTENNADSYSAEIEYEYTNYKGDKHTDKLTPPVFTNFYNASSNYTILINKKFTSNIGTYKPTNGELYEFKINDDFERNGNKSGYKLPENKTVTLTYNGTDFVSSNNIIKFNKAGDYRFELSEVVGEVEGITYDTNKWILDINVTDKGDGTFNISPEYYNEHAALNKEDKATFTNKHTSTVSLGLNVSKELLGRDINDDDTFTFSVHHSEESVSDPCDPNNYDHSHTNLKHISKIIMNNTTSFDLNIPNAIRIHKVGKYYVSVVEDVPANAKMDYDPSVYILEVEVEQVGNTLKTKDGSLKYYKAPNVTGWNSKLDATENFKFTNKTTNLSIQKKAESCLPNSKFKFEITLTNSDNTPMSNLNIHTIIGENSHNLSTDENGKTSFTLAANEILIIPDLPKGTKYKIEEANTPVTTTSIIRKENGVEKPLVEGKTIEDNLEVGVNEFIIYRNKGSYNPGNNNSYKAPDTGNK